MALRTSLVGGLSLLTLVCGVSAWAQPAPSPGQMAPPPGAPIRPAAPEGVVIPETAPTVAPPGTERLELTVGRVEIEGGYLPLDAETSAAVDGVAGKRVTVARLYEVAGAVERYYAAQGYFLTRVVIPPQQVRDGQTLRLRIVEGFIEAVDTGDLPSNIRTRIEAILAGLVGERRLTLPVLERKLLLAGDTPGASLRSTITPGAQAGGVRLVIRGEYRPVSAELGFDNYYAKSFGRTEVTASVSINSVLGLGEQLYGSLAGAPSRGFLEPDAARRLGSIGVLVPLSLDGLVLNVEATGSTTRPHLPPGSLQTESEYGRLSLRLLYPLIRSRTENLTPRLALDIINEQQTAPDFDATLYKDRIRPLRAGASWTRGFDSGTTLSLAGDLSQGLPIFGSRGRGDATISKPISRLRADDDFTKGEINARIVQRLPASFTIDATFYGQYSFSGPLFNAEQFTLGGPRRLSAYDIAEFAGDHGWLARVELQYANAFAWSPVRGLLMPYVFVARGKVYVDKPTVVEVPSVGGTSLGLGVRTNFAGTEPAAREVEFQFEAARQYTDRGPASDGWRFNVAGTLRF